ncbi:MAG: 2-oxoacid:acceptor oxidoreductase family protein [Coriobacteriaceae bacterium]|nr:2-oxoacid:acceptor oxidoreductase family protein [Coriobacteriaceae bacterium]
MATTQKIIWLGRGGQGAFSAAKLLGAAYALGAPDHHALAFPSFGPERRGAPVRAYTKLSDAPINDRSSIVQADFVVCLDETLNDAGVADLLKPEGEFLLVNERITDLAREVLGREIVNTALLALLATRLTSLDCSDLERGIEATMNERIRPKNIELVRRVFAQKDELL